MKVLVVLTLCVALAITQSGRPIVVAGIIPLLVALVASHIDRQGGRIAVCLVTASARVIPSQDRCGLRDEWVDHVRAAGEHGLPPLTRALSILVVAAPMLAIGLRIGRGTRERA